MDVEKPVRTHVQVPVQLMQEIVNYLLECKAKETLGMLLELKKLEEPSMPQPVEANE